MQPRNHSLLLGTITLAVLSGCNFSSPWGSSSGGAEYGATAAGSGSGGATTPPKSGVGGESGTNGSDDTVFASSSTSLMSVTVGASQTLAVTFTSSDGLATTGFGISASLGTLPAGWSGPAQFTCALVQAGSDCVLNLTYAPSAAASGTLTLDYIYVDNAGLSKVPGGTISIPFQAVAANNVFATAFPSGQVNAAVGSGSQSVIVNFATDTSNATLDEAATSLSVTTDLTALPSGWSSAATSFSCAIVITGNGCQLALAYAPSAAGRGVLTLDYSYMDDGGAPRTGTINIPYSNTSADTVAAAASPAGEITAVKGGAQAVAVTFTTDDGRAASNLLVTTRLSALPAGWHSGAGSFTCGSVSTGNGCQLGLTYAPTALGSGTLSLNYAYTDDSGAAQTGTLDVPYTATTNDNVAAIVSPSGQVNGVASYMGSPNVSVPVSIVFNTDDGRLATALQLTSSLAALPAGWTSSSGSSFACTSVSSGSTCELGLIYDPTAAGTGTLMLNYSYKNNANQAKTASVSIPYRATTDDSIVGTPNQPSVAVITGSSTAVTVTFATDDGNPASNLAITSGLSPLATGWQSTDTTFSCATVSDGTVCQLPLTYAPTAVGNGTLSLGFSYSNDAGMTKTGTASILYRANSNDTIGAVANPPSPVTLAVGSGPQPVTVTFTTSDGAPATSLSVTSGLASLPAGWSGPASFTCPTVSGTAPPCQLPLTFTPGMGDSGTLQIDYAYTNNAGTAETGSVSISYDAT
jgi:hypothetical protein